VYSGGSSAENIARESWAHCSGIEIKEGKDANRG